MAHLQLLHLVARAAAGARPFRHRHACAEIWSRVTRNFDVAALVLMPDHIHLLAQIQHESALRTFGRVLSAFRLRMQASENPEFSFEWERLPIPEKVQRDRRHVARTIRYIHLNPTRDGLCSDPLEWEWSTHRDWIGAVARPCVDRARWAGAMGKRMPSCIDWLHEYVSSDPSVARRLPPADPTPFLHSAAKDASIDALLWAVPRALRSHRNLPHEFGLAERRLFLLSAARWTRYSGAELARHLGCHPTSAQRTIRRQRGDEASGRGSRRDVQEARDRTDADGAVHRQAPILQAANANAASPQPDRNALTANELRAMALLLSDPRFTSDAPFRAAPARRYAGGDAASASSRRK